MTKRTDLQIIADGDFAKIGKKHFRHVTGAEIQYDCMAWGWRACGPMRASIWCYATLRTMSVPCSRA